MMKPSTPTWSGISFLEIFDLHKMLEKRFTHAGTINVLDLVEWKIDFLFHDPHLLLVSVNVVPELSLCILVPSFFVISSLDIGSLMRVWTRNLFMYLNVNCMVLLSSFWSPSSEWEQCRTSRPLDADLHISELNPPQCDWSDGKNCARGAIEAEGLGNGHYPAFYSRHGAETLFAQTGNLHGFGDSQIHWKRCTYYRTFLSSIPGQTDLTLAIFTKADGFKQQGLKTGKMWLLSRSAVLSVRWLWIL